MFIWKKLPTSEATQLKRVSADNSVSSHSLLRLLSENTICAPVPWSICNEVVEVHFFKYHRFCLSSSHLSVCSEGVLTSFLMLLPSLIVYWMIMENGAYLNVASIVLLYLLYKQYNL